MSGVVMLSVLLSIILQLMSGKENLGNSIYISINIWLIGNKEVHLLVLQG